MKQELKDLPTILKSLVNSSSIQKVILDCCVQREAEEDVGTEKMQEQDKCMQEYAKEITSALLCLPCEKLEIRVILTSHPFWDLLNGVYCNVQGGIKYFSFSEFLSMSALRSMIIQEIQEGTSDYMNIKDIAAGLENNKSLKRLQVF